MSRVAASPVELVEIALLVAACTEETEQIEEEVDKVEIEAQRTDCCQSAFAACG